MFFFVVVGFGVKHLFGLALSVLKGDDFTTGHMFSLLVVFNV